jgi:hypothetical protein
MPDLDIGRLADGAFWRPWDIVDSFLDLVEEEIWNQMFLYSH